MEYACGRSLTGAGNCVVELKSIYVLGTLVYVSLLRSNLTYTILLKGELQQTRYRGLTNSI